MSVLHDVRQELRDFLARDERGELDIGLRRALIDATIRDLQDFEVQLSNAMAVLMAKEQAPSAHQDYKEGGYVAGSNLGDKSAHTV